MKKLMTFVAALMLTASSFSLSAADLEYVDASTLTIIGKPFPAGTHPFRRIENFDFRQQSVNRKAAHSTGVAVVFKTDSRTIAAQWVTDSSALNNMNPIGCKGLDLYIKDAEGKWLYAGSGRPNMEGNRTRHSRTLVSHMAPGEKECLLYLPLYNRCDSLSLGFDKGALTAPMDNPFRHEVFFGGSSITHGAAANRAGQCYTGLLGLKYGVYAVNFGFSGDFKLQKPLAEYAAKADPDVYIFDAFSNPTAEEIRTNFDPFMDILRAARPTTPVIFLQTERRETRNFNLRADSLGQAVQQAAREMVFRRQLKDANLYFIDSKDFLTPDGMSTVDGSHPTDVAFERTVDIIWPLLHRLLERKPNPRVEDLLSRMTLEEKIGQLNLMPANGDVVTGPQKGKDLTEDIRKGRIGNVLNAVGLDYIRSLQKIAVEESRLGIPLTFGFDEIHGYRTTFPISLAESCTWDPGLIGRCARAAAQEAAADGLNLTYNPMVDIALDPRWGRISEGSGEDPYLGSLIAAARVRAVQGEKLSDPLTLAACLKHYAAYGLPEGGRDYAAVEMSENRYRNFYMPPYRAAIDAGVASVMTSFNLFNGIPATANHLLLNRILRGEWDYDGVVMTDYGSIREMLKHGCAENLAQAAKLALDATTDMDMCSQAYVRELAGLVKNGEIHMQQINEACRRVLQLKDDLGLLDDPYRYIDENRAKKVLRSKENLALSKEEAVRSMVLLKNQDAVLPLKKNDRIALVGELCEDAGRRAYCGAWAGRCEPDRMLSIRERFKKEKLVSPEEADKIVCVLGEDHTMSGEAASRTDIRIPAKQREQLEQVCALGKPVVLVVLSGRPLDLSRESEIAASILMAWQPGSMTADALYDLLYGKRSPSGRLTASFPRSVGQIPVYHYMCNTGRPATDGKKQRYVSNYIDSWNAPLYPFGYGLTYTSFEYSEPVLSGERLRAGETLTASVTVRNTGREKGDELVQLYLQDKVGSVSRPLKMLRGFERITLRPGESKTVSFTIDEEMLKFWRADGTFGSEPGEFAVFIGPDASTKASKSFYLQ